MMVTGEDQRRTRRTAGGGTVEIEIDSREEGAGAGQLPRESCAVSLIKGLLPVLSEAGLGQQDP
jgi:hypothetical protein